MTILEGHLRKVRAVKVPGRRRVSRIKPASKQPQHLEFQVNYSVFDLGYIEFNMNIIKVVVIFLYIFF